MSRMQYLRKYTVGLSPSRPGKIVKRFNKLPLEKTRSLTPNRKIFKHQPSNDLQKTFDITLSYSPIKRMEKQHIQQKSIRKPRKIDFKKPRGRPRKKSNVNVKKEKIHKKKSIIDLPKFEVETEIDDLSLPDGIIYFPGIEIITEIELSLSVLNQNQV
jgi:hypothetical protein